MKNTIRRYILKSTISLFFPILITFILISSSYAHITNIDEKEGSIADTIVEISPPDKTVLLEEVFTIDVYVTPGVPINGISIDTLRFNSGLLQADSVVEGDLFDGAPSTLFNPGVIDNNLGEINNVFDLTVPATYTVTDPGVFCTITFTAQQLIGTSSLLMDDVSVSNETGGYADILIFNGSVFVNESKNFPPVCSNEIPVSGSTDVLLGLSELNVDIEDPEGDVFEWSIETSPFVGGASDSEDGNGTKSCYLIELDLNTEYFWYVNVSDIESGEWTREVYSFTTTSDANHPPEIPELVGTSIVKPLTEYSYEANTTDPESDNISYFFDWGDGSDSGWTEYGPSGVAVNRTHSWEEGNYSIKVKSRDINNAESSWSEPLKINVSKLIAINNLELGYFYFLNVSWAYVYFFDLLGLSVVLNDRLTISADVRENVDYVEFHAWGQVIGYAEIVYDYNMSDGCLIRFDPFNVSHGLYNITVIAYDDQGNELDRDILPLIVFIEFNQDPMKRFFR